jgi:hypothetical protein
LGEDKEGKEKGPEEAPPHESGGMVSEETLMKHIKELRGGEQTEIPPFDVLMLFLIEKLVDIKNELKRIGDAFEGTPKTMPPVKEEGKDKVPEAPEHKGAPVTEEPATLRVEEIVQKLSKFEELITIDLESSAQFVIVKPKEYLKERWNDVMTPIRGLGGEWVSQGKEGHWIIPKLGKDEKKAEQSTQKKIDENASPVDKVKILFPQELETMLTFTLTNDYVVIKPRQFLGSENFAKIASIVREASGEYISAGKESHFRIPAK